MKTNVCKVCGIDWTSSWNSAGEILCPRCVTTIDANRGIHYDKNALADAPPLPSAEIEAIKVAMMQTGWVFGKD